MILRSETSNRENVYIIHYWQSFSKWLNKKLVFYFKLEIVQRLAFQN